MKPVAKGMKFVAVAVSSGALSAVGAMPAAADSRVAVSVATKASSLPTGPATGYPFGYVMDEGSKTSLLPPNDGDVDQSRVASAPRVGPFTINPNGPPTVWPDACKLTSLAQLKALEPSITGLRGKPAGSKAELLGTGHTAPHNTQCQFNLKTTFEPQGYGSTGSYVIVQIEAIDTGAPALYREALTAQKGEAHKYPAQYADYPNLKNSVQCFDDSTELQCLKGDVNFWVGGQKVTGGDYFGSDQAIWVVQIEIPLAEVLGAELKTS
ncbi:MAG TPA: hypothetical protein VMF65_03260 [Acidimicrobiales bacterium]|nr:hypothetical protein [Acidimicrobiales bacterium]